jgi:hypothetical protein
MTSRGNSFSNGPGGHGCSAAGPVFSAIGDTLGLAPELWTGAVDPREVTMPGARW